MTMQITLTDCDIDVMIRAAWLQRKHNAGIGPRRGPQFRQYKKLERHGLLACEGWGRDIDAETIEGRDLLVYRMTPLGWAVVHQREETRP